MGFPREKIAEFRAFFTKAGCDQFCIERNGLQLPVLIIPQSLEKELPHFAFQAVADDITPEENAALEPAAMLFGVCESIPVRFRGYAALHETSEYLDGVTCCEAVQAEIGALWADHHAFGLLREYLQMRIALFEPLVPYVERKAYPPHKIAEFKRSRDLYILWESTLR